MPAASLQLSERLEQRIQAAASVLRLSPEAFINRVLSQFFHTLGGLPRDVLRYILTFLDYSTISAVAGRVCRLWHDVVPQDPLQLFTRLRQMHGIHLLDPAHGLFYFPRALKRVAVETKVGAGGNTALSWSSPAVSTAAGTASTIGVEEHGASATATARRLASEQQQPQSNTQVIPASSFLSVSIRTQNTKSLPWGYVSETVRSAAMEERVAYGEVRTPSLQRSEEPVWSQTATVSYDRRIFVFGGETYEGIVLDRAYEYDPARKHWSVLPAMSEKRAAASAVVSGPYIFVFGGYNAQGDVLATYEVLDAETRTWFSQSYPPEELYRQGHGFANVSRGEQETLCGATGTNEGEARSLEGGPEPASPWPFPAGRPPSWTGARARSAVPGMYRMPDKVCGSAATTHGDVVLLVGGHRTCIAPEQTAVSYSDMNSTTTTPNPIARDGGAGGASNGNAGANDVSSSAASISVTSTPQRLPHAASISMNGPDTAETFVWVFCPRTGRWWKDGPPLPSPRAFGAVTVLELPILGPCLCYFGGCAKADAPETTMWYIPLHPASEVCVPHASDETTTPHANLHAPSVETLEEIDAPSGPPTSTTTTQPSPTSLSNTGTRHAVMGPIDDEREDVERVDAGMPAGGPPCEGIIGVRAHDPPFSGLVPDAVCAASNPSLSLLWQGIPLEREKEEGGGRRTDATTQAAAVAVEQTMLRRCFRNPRKLPWQRYVRIPIGGAFTSVAVLGAPHSRTLVLTGFYPAPNIGFCKVGELLPPDAFAPLLGDLLPRPPSPPHTVSPTGVEATTTAVSGSPPYGPSSPSSTELERTTSPFSPPPPILSQQRRPSSARDDHDAVVVHHWHQEREWSHLQRREMRQMVRAAAQAAVMRHPRDPQMAGEEHKWSVAPVPEVRVMGLNGPALLRVSWKMQTLNAKIIVGIE